MPKTMKFGSLLLILVTTVFAISCNRNAKERTAVTESTTPSAPASSPKTGFDADLDYVKKGQYTYVWVFSRKDGKPLDKDDAAYLRQNAPQVVDWVTTDTGKKVIAGTNFDLAKGNLGLLQKRFVAEDYTNK
jgi:hypothetical protein